MSEDKPEFPKDFPNSKGNGFGALLEVRIAEGFEPTDFQGLKIGREWKPVHVNDAFVKRFLEGNRPLPFQQMFLFHGVMEHSIAEALRWHLHAVFKHQSELGRGLESRLVVCEIKYSYDITQLHAEAYVTSD